MSTPAGLDPQAGALARLVIAAPVALRHENLCIVPALLLRPCLFEQFDHFRVAFLRCQH